MKNNKPASPAKHALSMIRAYFRDCAEREIADHRRNGEPLLSESFAGYLTLCDRVQPAADACAGVADPSAVPEMLAALKMCEQVFAKEPAHGPSSRLSMEEFRRLQGAIAKAEGRS